MPIAPGLPRRKRRVSQMVRASGPARAARPLAAEAASVGSAQQVADELLDLARLLGDGSAICLGQGRLDRGEDGHVRRRIGRSDVVDMSRHADRIGDAVRRGVRSCTELPRRRGAAR